MTEKQLREFQKEVLDDPLARDVWADKYRWNDEKSPDETRRRVVEALFEKDPDEKAKAQALDYVSRGLLIPGGRMNAGAGTGRAVTLMNCFVNETVDDSMAGIQRAIARAALTMQQGGGIGTDWSTVRPRGAVVGRTGSVSSGVIPFMDQMDAMCKTVVSSGSRRGAMMATLSDDHPDLWNPNQFKFEKDYYGEDVLVEPSFISAKRQKGRLTQFNVSVLISDAFMHAVENDLGWDLGSFVPRADGVHVDVYDRVFRGKEACVGNDLQNGSSSHVSRLEGNSYPWYVYRRVPARVIWEDLMRSTYTYAEPGVVFIDRVNNLNNLKYMEEIRCTNPCGEQPLPPFGTCCLGSVNMAFMVKDPFTPKASFDLALYESVIRCGVRMLDNALEVTNYPLGQQRHESMLKRRIGLGITGFADACVQLGIRYGSEECVAFASNASDALRDHSYHASALLAKERGCFPGFRLEKWAEDQPLHLLLITSTNMLIEKYGIRNGVLNTIAPNGTISVYVGNVSSGHEPVFSFKPTRRRVRQPDGSAKEYDSMNYSLKLWRRLRGDEELPPTFVGAMDVTPEEHVRVHAAWQEYIDASISKTINCPTEMSFDEFKGVYDLSYALGAKGCTTYRYDPAAGRGFVMQEKKEEPAFDNMEPISRYGIVKLTPTPEAENSDAAPSGPVSAPTLQPVVPTPSPAILQPRPDVVEGRTYKIKWALTNTNWYITITRSEGVPLEVFITTGDVQSQEWVTALSRMITGILRRGGDTDFVVEQLKEVHSARGDVWRGKKRYPSIVAAIAGVMEEEFEKIEKINSAFQEFANGFFGNDKDEWTEEDCNGLQNVEFNLGENTVFDPSKKTEQLQTQDERMQGALCHTCGLYMVIREAGCRKCLACGKEDCG